MTTPGNADAQGVETSHTRRWLVPVLAASAILLAAVGGVGAILTVQPQHSASVVDMRGNRVAPDVGATPDPATRKAMDAVDSGEAGARLQVPSVGLDVPLGALNAVEGVIQPPGFTSAYRVRNRGVSLKHPSQGTVFVVTHSLRKGGTAPGNYLIDVATGAAKVVPGAAITVDGVRYTVTGSEAIGKKQLASDAEVWAGIPNRLVLITCLQVPAHTASVDNLIITATR